MAKGGTRLTERVIAALSVEKGQLKRRDDQITGLVLTVGRTRKTWSVQGKLKAGKRISGTIGYWPEMSLKNARDVATSHLAKMAGGIDPFREADIERLTFVDCWVSLREIKRNKQSVQNNQKWWIEKHFKRFKDRDITSITYKEFASVYARLRRQYADATSTNLIRFFNSVITHGWDLLEIDKKSYLRRMTRNKRLPDSPIDPNKWIRPNQIKSVWESFLYMPEQMAAYFRFLLLTGLRYQNGRSLRWEQVDESEKLIRFEAEEMKSGSVFLLPIGQKTLEVIQSQPRKVEWVFSGPLGARVNRLTRWQEMSHDMTGVFWRCHYFRHTAATLMSERGDEYATAAVLNHKIHGVRARYTHVELDRMRRLVEWYERRIMALVNGEEEPGQIVQGNFGG